MTDKALPRPPQVTMAGWVTIVGSAFVVVSVYDVVSNLRSIDTRERVGGSLDDPPFDGLGLGVQQVLDVLHVVALIAGACAAAAAILGWFVLRRNRQARLALTIVAGPLFLAGMVAGGFLSSMVAVAAILLWSRPARDWFDGRAPARDVFASRGAGTAPGPSGGRTAGPGQPGAGPDAPHEGGDQAAPGGQPWAPPGQQGGPPPDQPSGPPPAQPSGPPPNQQWGMPPGRQPAPPGQQWAPPPPQGGPPPGPHPGYGAAQPRFSTARPPEVLQACLVTWVFAGLVLTAAAIALLGVLVDPGLVQDAMESDPRYADAGIGQDTLRTWVIVSAAVLVVWSAAAIVLAVFTFLGRNWARIGLVVSAIVTGMVTLLAVVGSPLVVILTVACGMCVLLLTRRAVSGWFAHRI